LPTRVFGLTVSYLKLDLMKVGFPGRRWGSLIKKLIPGVDIDISFGRFDL
jgi:hypothetical protein